ncbi:MAG TPA: SDR family NAD(P)-dependent oxidoreductase, partial [Pyrinomonadaceae bacterium]|nr:SDR family NAD(P)-dependent oxidoreductase [Pyrinomonadaceae bacterium]
WRELETERAFHSGLVEPVVGELVEAAERAGLREPEGAFVSGVSGRWAGSEVAEAEYWGRQAREAVRFGEGVEEVLGSGGEWYLLEVGAGRGLAALARQVVRGGKRVSAGGMGHECGATLSGAEARGAAKGEGKGEGKGEARGEDKREARGERQGEARGMVRELGRMWESGVAIGGGERGGRRVTLPTYPFERQSYWVEARQATNGHGALQRKSSVADWFYLPSWKRTMPAERPATSLEGEQPKRWLLFDDERGLGVEMAERLSREGAEVISVHAGESFARAGDDAFVVDVRRREDYYALLDALRDQNRLPQHIVHLWGVKTSDADAGEGALDEGFYSLMYLAQSLGEQVLSQLVGEETAAPAIAVTVVSEGMQDVTGEERLCPEKATLLGAATVIPQEYPGVTCRSVDVVLPESGTWQREALVEHLLAEAESQTTEPVVAYRNGQRWAQEFTQASWGEAGGRPPRLREGGVYLITGGLGGVGLALAEYLAREANAKLTLVGRSELPARDLWESRIEEDAAADGLGWKLRRLLALEASGAEVLTVSADVADLEQMRDALGATLARFGGLDGVIHAAGIVDGGLTQLKSTEAAARVLAPKVRGTRVLEALLKDTKLDFLILCSSIRAVLGGAGAFDYSAANAFLDLFARSKSREPGGRVISINWDGWLEVGMSVKSAPGAAHEGAAAAAAAVDGDTPLQEGMLTREGVEAFERILKARAPQVIVSTRDFPALVERNRQDTAATRLAEIKKARLAASAHPRPQLSNAYMAPRNEAEQTLADIWQSLLGLEQVGVHDNFFELGGDSVVSIQVIAKANQAGLRLTPKQVFEHQTIAELSAVAGQAPAIDAMQTTVTGDAPLLPIQHWFFEHPLAHPHHFNQAVLLEAREPLQPEPLRRALAALLSHHDALRLRFARSEAGGWRQWHAAPDADLPFSHVT